MLADGVHHPALDKTGFGLQHIPKISDEREQAAIAVNDVAVGVNAWGRLGFLGLALVEFGHQPAEDGLILVVGHVSHLSPFFRFFARILRCTSARRARRSAHWGHSVGSRAGAGPTGTISSI